MLSDLAKALDFKCQVVDKVAALLRELTVGMYESNYLILGSNVTFPIARARWLHFLIVVEMAIRNTLQDLVRPRVR